MKDETFQERPSASLFTDKELELANLEYLYHQDRPDKYIKAVMQLSNALGVHRAVIEKELDSRDRARRQNKK